MPTLAGARTAPQRLRGTMPAAPSPGAGRVLLHTQKTPGSGAIVPAMSATDPTQTQLAEITERVDRLVELCRRLSEENRVLRQSQENLASERAQLLARNEQARSRVEAMILRLKSLEQ